MPIVDEAGAVAALLAGQAVGVPTDTVYGLAVDPKVTGATGSLFALKGRPAAVELPVLVADLDQAEALAGPDGLSVPARRLAGRFWPGALTLVVTRRRGLEWELGGDGSTIGLRCPAHDQLRRLCRCVGPLATTSANRHGEPPLTTAEEVGEVLGAELPVLDGGRCDDAPSTVVDLTVLPPRCIRMGGVDMAEVLDVAARAGR